MPDKVYKRLHMNLNYIDFQCVAFFKPYLSPIESIWIWYTFGTLLIIVLLFPPAHQGLEGLWHYFGK